MGPQPFFLAITLASTSLGLVVPVLADAGHLRTVFGRLTIAGATAGEFGAITLLSLFFSATKGGTASNVIAFGTFGAVVAAVGVTLGRVGRNLRLDAFLTRLQDATAEIRVRIAVALLVGSGPRRARLTSSPWWQAGQGHPPIRAWRTGARGGPFTLGDTGRGAGRRRPAAAGLQQRARPTGRPAHQRHHGRGRPGSRIVYTSMLNADDSTSPLAGEHRDTERALRDAGVPFTLLRNGYYTEVHTDPLGQYFKDR